MSVFLITFFTILFNVESSPSIRNGIDSSWASEKDILIQHFTQNDGLPLNSVNGLVYHSDGFMYLSTLGGLSRFDGFTFTTLSANDGVFLPESRFTHVGSLKNGNLFVLSETGIQYIFNPNNAKQPVFKLTPGHTAVYSDSLLAASFNTDSLVYYTETLQIRHIEHILGESLQSVLVHSSGWQLKHTNKALYIKTSTNSKRIDNIDLPFIFSHPINGKRFLKLIELSNHNVGIIGFSGVMILDASGSIIFSHRFNPDYFAVNLLAIDSNRVLITGHSNFYEVNISTGSIKPVTQFENTFASETSFPTEWLNKPLFVSYDRIQWGNKELYRANGSQEIWACYLHPITNDLWIGTQGKGLLRLFPSYFYTLNASKGLLGENVYGIEGDSVTNLLISTFDKGLIHLTKTEANILNDAYRLGRSVIFSNSPNSALSGKWGGLLDRYQLKTGEFERLNMQDDDTLFHYSDVNSLDLLFKDSQKRIWIGTRVQLLRLSADEKNYTRILNPQSEYIPGISSMLELDSETFLLGSIYRGLYIYNKGVIQSLNHKNLSTAIRHILAENDSTFWLATENKGIQQITLNRKLDSITTIFSVNSNHGFPHKMVHRILADTLGSLWVSTNNGLIKFDRNYLHHAIRSSNLTQLFYQTFSINHGLPINEFNGGTSQSGINLDNNDLIFPGQKGIVLIKPYEKQFINEDHSASIYLKNAIYGDTVLFNTNTSFLDLQNDERFLSIQLGINSFLSEREYHIQFKTDDAIQWKNVSNDNTLNFSGLSSGIHSILFRFNNQQNPLKNTFKLTVSVQPYFYETISFRLFVGAILVLGIFLGFERQRNKHSILEKRLTKEVQKRTREIEQERIKTEHALSIIEQQAARLETISQYKEDVFMGITHELKTPLSLIQGPLEIIQESLNQNDTKSIERQLLIIKNNARRLKDLVNKTLTTIRYSADSETFSMNNYDSNQLILSCINSMQEESNLKNIHIILNNEQTNRTVTTDLVAFELILGNIIQNAIKYSNNNTTCVIKSTFIDQNWIISVADSGIGIEKDQIDKIFNPYYRVVHSEKNPGAGIGLTVAKRICTLMNGSIEVSSKLGKGSTFTIRLPLQENPSTQDVENSKQLASKQAKSSAMQNLNDNRKRILLVDDNHDFIVFLTDVLQNDYVIYSAENGESALQIVHNTPIDAIVSDVMMPRMGGIELAKQISENAIFKNIAFMFLSADDKESTIQKGFSYGAEVYLTKPIQVESLRINLSALLLRRDNLPLEKNSSYLATQVEEIILKHLTDSQLSIDQIAHVLGLSRSNLYGKWSKIHPLTINDFITYLRIRETFTLMYKENLNVSQACIACGFKYSAYMSRVFKKKYGLQPTEYIKQNPGKIPGMISP
jgi:signal transduction histidine kinase/CheY-like chemotaxis protein/ligand-binding sensor domain-containing protein